MMNTVDSARPPRWLSAFVLAGSALFGAWAAVELDFDGGILWLWGLAVLGVAGGSGHLIGRITKRNPGRSKVPVRRGLLVARLLALIAVGQLPAVAWRLTEGDPEIRAAKAYCDEIAEDTWASLDAQGQLDGPAGATVLPGVRGLPPFIHEHGLWFATREGRARMGFQRDRDGFVDHYSLDIDRGEWDRSRVRDAAP